MTSRKERKRLAMIAALAFVAAHSAAAHAAPVNCDPNMRASETLNRMSVLLDQGDVASAQKVVAWLQQHCIKGIVVQGTSHSLGDLQVLAAKGDAAAMKVIAAAAAGGAEYASDQRGCCVNDQSTTGQKGSNQSGGQSGGGQAGGGTSGDDPSRSEGQDYFPVGSHG